MKLCFSTLTCPSWSLQQILTTAQANGIGGVDLRGLLDEIDITRLPEFGENLTQTMALFEQHRVEIPCLNTSVTLISPAPERWRTMLEECQRYAQLAGKIGTRYLRIFGGVVPKGMTRDEGRMMAQRHLRQVVKVCRTGDCRPLLETHDDWTTSAEVMELLHEFSPDEVGVLWDVEHPYRRGEKPSDTVNNLRKFLFHVHLKDSQRMGGRSAPKLIGDGDLPLKAMLAALREIAYRGWLCLETEKRWHPQQAPEPEQSIPTFVKWIRELTSQ